MLVRLRLFFLLPLATLIACGGSSAPTIGTIAYTPVAGDYVITVGVGTASQTNFNGNLIVTGTTVSGVFRYANVAACVPATQDIPFTGTFANSVLTLTSATFSNSVATFTVKLPLSNNNIDQQLASGTSVITGGTCALASSTLQAQLIPSFSGSWTVALTSPSNATATLQVTQSAANADGQFPATGTVSCAGSSTPTALTGLVSGASLQLATTAQGSPIVTANYSAVPVAVSACGGTGTMTQ